MRNIDKYKDELLLNTIAYAVAVDKQTRKIKPCNGNDCRDCLFNKPTGCDGLKLEWLQAEYEEPEVDWSKIEVDTPIYVRQYEDNDWVRRHFAKYENGRVCAWSNGTTSHTAEDKKYYTRWEYAELAENFITTNERVLDE